MASLYTETARFKWPGHKKEFNLINSEPTFSQLCTGNWDSVSIIFFKYSFLQEHANWDEPYSIVLNSNSFKHEEQEEHELSQTRGKAA